MECSSWNMPSREYIKSNGLKSPEMAGSARWKRQTPKAGRTDKASGHWIAASTPSNSFDPPSMFMLNASCFLTACCMLICVSHGVPWGTLFSLSTILFVALLSLKCMGLQFSFVILYLSGITPSCNLHRATFALSFYQSLAYILRQLSTIFSRQFSIFYSRSSAHFLTD